MKWVAGAFAKKQSRETNAKARKLVKKWGFTYCKKQKAKPQHSLTPEPSLEVLVGRALNRLRKAPLTLILNFEKSV